MIVKWEPCEFYQKDQKERYRRNDIQVDMKSSESDSNETLTQELIMSHTSENESDIYFKYITHKLWPFSKLSISVSILNGASNGPWSEEVHVETPEGGD